MKAHTNKPHTRGIRHVIQATGYSLKGLRAALVHEEAFRLELMAAVLLTPPALWLGQGAAEKVLLVGSLVLVLIVELINSALEAVVDRIGVAVHPLSGRAKDMGSAAVMLTLLNAAVVWAIILWYRFFT